MCFVTSPQNKIHCWWFLKLFCFCHIGNMKLNKVLKTSSDNTVRACVRVRACVCVRACACARARIGTYMHTHKHTHTHTLYCHWMFLTPYSISTLHATETEPLEEQPSVCMYSCFLYQAGCTN